MLKQHRAINRRLFMQACGLGAGSLFLPSLLPRAAAAPGDPPLRIVFFFTDHGTFYPNWRMRLPNSPQSETVDFEFALGGLTEEQFSPILRPLYPYRDEMIVLDGLALLSAINDPYGDGHAKGWCAALTGAHAGYTYDGTRSHAAVPSIDQTIKDFLRAQDPGLTDFASLEYAIGTSGVTYHHLNYRSDGNGGAVKVPFEAEPKAAFDQIFGLIGDDMPDPVRAMRLSVVDRVREQYDLMAPKLSGEDRAKLELHRDLIHDLHQRIEAFENLVCEAPAIEQQWFDDWNAAQFAYKRDGFVDLLATAFSCRISRVATVYSWIPPMEMIGGAGDYHHDYAHQSGPDAPLEKQQVVTNAERVLAETLVAFAERLKQIPEGDGTVYDNTIIVWMSELADGGHSHNQWPVVILGGCGGKFKGGRYLRFAETVPHPVIEFNTWGTVGQPHQPLLTSLCQAFGMDVDSTGTTSVTCHIDDEIVEVSTTGRMERLYG